MRRVCCSFSWVAAISASSRAASSCRAFSASSLPAWARPGSVRKLWNWFEMHYLLLGLSIYHRTWFVLTSSNCWNVQKFQFGICVICICNPFEQSSKQSSFVTFSFPSSSTICFCFSSSAFSRPSILLLASASCCFRLFTSWGEPSWPGDGFWPGPPARMFASCRSIWV